MSTIKEKEESEVRQKQGRYWDACDKEYFWLNFKHIANLLRNIESEFMQISDIQLKVFFF